MSDVILIGRKCSCHSVWCRDCFRVFRLPAIRRVVEGWNWRCVRHVVFTLDRRLFADAGEGYDWGKGKLRYVIEDLKRTVGIDVKAWYSFLEWHKDGFPHWHLLFYVGKAGKAGMIGGANIRRYWDRGAVRESYFATRGHYDRVVGYFNKTGYFEKGKRYQGELPEWIRGRGVRVKRVNKSVEKRRQDLEKEVKIVSFVKSGGAVFRGYNRVLESCGIKTVVSALYRGTNYLGYAISVPYKEFRRLRGEWRAGLGYYVRLEEKFFLTFCRDCRELAESVLAGVVEGATLKVRC